MKMKNKVLIGLLLAAQVNGMKAFDGAERDEYRIADIREFSSLPPQLKAEYNKLVEAYASANAKLQDFKWAHLPRWRGSLARYTQDAHYADYADYVKNIKEQNRIITAQAEAHQREYIKQHPNQPVPYIEITEINTMTKDEWMKSRSF